MVNYIEDPAVEDAIPEPGLLLSDHFKSPFGYRGYRPRGTPAWLMFYTIGGHGAIRIGQEEWICESQQITLLKPGAPHQYYTVKDSVWDFYWVYFNPRISWADWMNYEERLKGCTVVPMEGKQVNLRIANAFDKMIHDTAPINAIQEELTLNALEEIILLIYRQLEGQKDNQIDPRIKKVLTLLNVQYAVAHTIEELAKSVCMSPSRLSHLFKEQVGGSMIDTLLQIRLKQGARLLHYTAMSVNEIADATGFHSSNYFTRKFNAFYGISPTVYRGRSREKP